MAKNPNPKKRPAPSRESDMRSARPATAAPKRKRSDAGAEEATTGNILWRLALIFCCALVVISLVVTSVTGGSELIGGPVKKDTSTPTPPVASVDPNQTVTGSDATPIPPSPIVVPTDAPPTD